MSPSEALVLGEAIDAFAVSLAAAGKRPNTIRCYQRDLGLLLAYAGSVPVAGLTPALLDTFVLTDAVRLTATGVPKAPSSVGRIKATLRSFGSWLVDLEHLDRNPARRLKVDRAARSAPAYLSDAECKRARQALNARRGAAVERDRVMLSVFLGTGVRLNELVGLDLIDVRLDDKRLVVLAKGGRPHHVFLHADVRRVLRRYIVWRRKQAVETEALFLSGRGERLSARQVARRVALWYEWAGIARPGLTVHSLRHTVGTQLYRRTSDLVLVGKVLGHRSVETTRIYTHVDEGDLEAALEAI